MMTSSAVDRVLQSARKVSITLLGFVMLAGIAINFGNAVYRYGFGGTFRWAEEVMVFGLIFIVMFGSVVAVAVAGNEHLRINVVTEVLPTRIVLVLDGLILVLTTVLFALLAYYSLNVVELMLRLGQTSVAARIPMWIPHSFMLLSFAGSAVIAACRLALLIADAARKGMERTAHQSRDHMTDSLGEFMRPDPKESK